MLDYLVCFLLIVSMVPLALRHSHLFESKQVHLSTTAYEPAVNWWCKLTCSQVVNWVSYRSILQTTSWETVGWDVLRLLVCLPSTLPFTWPEFVWMQLVLKREITIGAYGIPPKQKSLTWLRLYTTNNCLVYFTERLYNPWSKGPVPV